jgi:hypothetical protein
MRAMMRAIDKPGIRMLFSRNLAERRAGREPGGAKKQKR